MKKLLAMIVTVSIVLSMGAICVSAALGTWLTGAENFRPVGDVAIDWDAEAGAKLNLTDGQMDDWVAAGYTPIRITPDNMVSWVGGVEGMPAGFGIRAYFVADPQYLYVALDITDANTVLGSREDLYNNDGDSIQMMMDLGGWVRNLQMYDPDTADILTSKSGIFYSCDANGDGAPLQIMRQESDNNGWLSEANGDAIKGTTGQTEDGWFVEMALSWQMLYDDLMLKTYDSVASGFYLGEQTNMRLSCPIALYYLNMEQPDSGITWAAGTTSGRTDEAGNPDLYWDALEAGIELYLEYEEGMFFECTGLHIGNPPSVETEAPTDAVTEAPTEAPTEETVEVDTELATEPLTEVDTIAPEEWTLPDEMGTLDEGVLETMEEYFYEMGCEMSVGMGTVTLLAVAAAIVLKKKDD